MWARKTRLRVGPESCHQSRDDRIRTCGPFVPNEVRYQAALHPDGLSLGDGLSSQARQAHF